MCICTCVYMYIHVHVYVHVHVLQELRIYCIVGVTSYNISRRITSSVHFDVHWDGLHVPFSCSAQRLAHLPPHLHQHLHSESTHHWSESFEHVLVKSVNCNIVISWSRVHTFLAHDWNPCLWSSVLSGVRVLAPVYLPGPILIFPLHQTDIYTQQTILKYF